MTDNELVQAYLAGDESAVTATKEKYRHYLYKISFQILGDNEDVEECMNDVYLAAWKSIPQDKPGMLLPYLRKITRRISIDKLRMRSSKKRITNDVYGFTNAYTYSNSKTVIAANRTMPIRSLKNFKNLIFYVSSYLPHCHFHR